jgi:hypothetical protein
MERTMWFRRRVSSVILLFPLVLLCGGVLVWNLPVLKAGQDSEEPPTASLLVRCEEPTVIPRSQGGSAPDSELCYKRFQKTQISLLKSRRVVVAALGLRRLSEIPAIKNGKDPFHWLADHLRASFQDDSEVLEVSLKPGTGMSREEQARVVNAIQNAYLDDVVNQELRSQRNRQKQLKRLNQTYSDLIKDRRERLREFAAARAPKDPAAGLDKDATLHRYHELRSLQLKLRLDQAEAEALLARRKKAEGAGTDQVRKEIAHLEDRLAVVSAQKDVVREMLADLEGRLYKFTEASSEATELADELKGTEETRNRIAAVVDKLEIELQAPPRVMKLDEAVP